MADTMRHVVQFSQAGVHAVLHFVGDAEGFVLSDAQAKRWRYSLCCTPGCAHEACRAEPVFAEGSARIVEDALLPGPCGLPERTCLVLWPEGRGASDANGATAP